MPGSFEDDELTMNFNVIHRRCFTAIFGISASVVETVLKIDAVMVYRTKKGIAKVTPFALNG